MRLGICGEGVVGIALRDLLTYLNHEVHCYDKFKASESFDMVKKYSKVIFLCLPTPDSENGVDMSAFDDLMPKLKGFDGVIVIKSTVLPGTAAKYRGKYGLRIVSNPEFLREGAAIKDFMNADRVVVGHESEKAKIKMEKLYRTFVRTFRPIIFVDVKSAEIIAKLSHISFLSQDLFNSKVPFNYWIHLKVKRVPRIFISSKCAGNTHITFLHQSKGAIQA